MIYPSIPLDRWLEKYPHLVDDNPLCECEEPNIVPVAWRESRGIVCMKCNSGAWLNFNTKLAENVMNALAHCGGYS